MPNRMDSMLSHGMARVKAVKARLSGLVGVFKTLASEHGEVRVLLERAKTSDERFVDLWPTIRRELISHEKAERRELYPVLRAHPETRSIADHHDAEADELDALIASVDALGVGTPELRATFQRLIDLVVHHAHEEESNFFPKAQEVIGKDRAELIEPKFLAAKRQLALMH
jgi:hemerythrin superfamily protein